MARALRLAERGLYSTTPNPRVGCVIVKDGAVVGEGYHERAGRAACGSRALQAAGARARRRDGLRHAGALQSPRSHAALCRMRFRKLASRAWSRRCKIQIRRVSGQGFERLRAAGIVTAMRRSGGASARAQYRFRRAHDARRVLGCASKRQRAWMAARRSPTERVNGSPAKRRARDGHRWRARSCAVMVGIGTLLADNPRLTVRHVATDRQPLRIVVDRHLQMPLDAKVLEGGDALIVTAEADSEKARRLHEMGVEILSLPDATRQSRPAGAHAGAGAARDQ